MEKEKKAEDFLGSGWRYPILAGDSSIVSKREKSIEESILIIIGTMKGERVMRPDFGCDLHRMVFDLNNEVTHIQAANYVRTALEKWEPRITILDVKAYADDEEQNKLYIDIDYEIISSNTKLNMVYPFYI